jgi:hypothetical protein
MTNPNFASGSRFWWANPQAHAHTLSGPARRPRRRLLFGSFNARRRYLTGLGQDDSSIYDEGAITNATDVAIPTSYSAGQLANIQPSTPDIPMLASGYAPVALPAGTYPSSSAPGTTVSVLPGGSLSVAVAPPAAGSSWLSQPGVGGLSNGAVLLGVGAIGLLAMFSSKGRR